MRVLVTGATGFVGRHVVERLLREGHEVIASSRTVERAKGFGWFEKVRFEPFDLAEPGGGCFERLGEPEILIHLSWQGLPNYKGLFHFERNLGENYAFLKAMVEQGLKHCVVAGTCLEYGMREGALDETMDPRPHTPYGLAKDVLRRFLEMLQVEHAFGLTWVRLFYMFGPGQASGSIISQLEQALKRGDPVFDMSGGKQLRDYLPVEAVADHLVRLAIQRRGHGVVNCCSGKPVAIKDFVAGYLKTRGGRINLNLGHYPYPDYEPMEFWGDAGKLGKALAAGEP